MKNKFIKNRKGFVFTVGFVLAVGLAIVLFLFAGSGGLSATWKAGTTLSGIVDILASIPPVAWVIIGVFCLLIILKKR